jgi:uncharacterized protein YoxC
MSKLDNETILIAFAVVTGLAMLLQTIILLAISVAVRKTANSIREEVENLHSSVMPVIYDARDMLANTQGILTNTQELLANAQGFVSRMTPKVEAVTADLAQITRTLRVQTAEMQSSAVEIMDRVKRQSNRLDEMVTNLLDTADRAGGFVVNAVNKPVRQISSMLGAVKAVVESLRGSQMRQPVPPIADEDRFF